MPTARDAGSSTTRSRSPSPAPVTTIAWRTVHIGAVNYLYWDYAFGPATASFDLEMPGDADSAVAWLRDSQRPLAETLSELGTDEALDQQVLTNWCERLPVSPYLQDSRQ
jgi:hypothetical protein